VLKAYLNKADTNWLTWLLMAEFWYNSTVHTSTGKSSFEIIFGRNLRNTVDATLEVEWNKENRKAVELLDELLHSQAAWKLVQPNMEWRERDLTTTKEERKVKKRIKESQSHFKLYFDKK
jgi:hypothetical protein